MIPHNQPTLGIKEELASKRVIKSGWLAQGQEVTQFENELCDFFDLPHGHVVAVSSGTAALYLALWVLESKHKNIGLPVYSCSALTNAVNMVGANPIFLDCSVNSPNLDTSSKKLTSIDTLIAPSMFGIPINSINSDQSLVIEDISQAFGSKVNNQAIGLRGDIGICSFYATKIITSGGHGGMLMSKDKNLIDLIRDYREFDNRQDSKHRFNFQLTEIQAAIGRSQLSQLSQFNEQREHIFDIYKSAQLPLLVSKNKRDYALKYRAVITVDKPKYLMKKLNDIEVTTIIPVEQGELLDKNNDYPNAQWLADNTLSLPIYPQLTLSSAHQIAQCVADNLE